MQKPMELEAAKEGIMAHWGKVPCGPVAIQMLEGITKAPGKLTYDFTDLVALADGADLQVVIPALAILAQSEFAVLVPCDAEQTDRITFTCTANLI